MPVLTGFYFIKAETIKMLEANPELMDRLLGYSHAPKAGAQLGSMNDGLPPRLDIEKAWDEILLLLAGCGFHEVYQALHISVWEEYDGCEEIRLFSQPVVKKGLAALEGLKIERLRCEALRRDLRTYDGDPIHYLLDDTLAHVERLREFWRAAVFAEEAIISATDSRKFCLKASKASVFDQNSLI